LRQKIKTCLEYWDCERNERDIMMDLNESKLTLEMVSQSLHQGVKDLYYYVSIGTANENGQDDGFLCSVQHPVDSTKTLFLWFELSMSPYDRIVYIYCHDNLDILLSKTTLDVTFTAFRALSFEFIVFDPCLKRDFLVFQNSILQN
jgi:hypothetical protein